MTDRVQLWVTHHTWLILHSGESNMSVLVGTFPHRLFSSAGCEAVNMSCGWILWSLVGVKGWKCSRASRKIVCKTLADWLRRALGSVLFQFLIKLCSMRLISLWGQVLLVQHWTRDEQYGFWNRSQHRWVVRTPSAGWSSFIQKWKDVKKRSEEKKWGAHDVFCSSCFIKGTRTFTWKHISSTLTWTTDSHTEWRGEGFIQFIRGLEFALYFKDDLLTGWSFSCSCRSSLFTGVFTAVSSTYCSQGRTELWRKEKQLFMLRAERGFYFLWFPKRCPHIHTSGTSEQRKPHTF